MSIPWLPLSVIGTAVAFYVGFKNNQAYDRLWEGRKIWGAIVNISRAWGAMITSYVTNQFREDALRPEHLKRRHQELIYRHIAWLYTLRRQLLQPEPWEHINQGMHIGVVAQRRMERFGLGVIESQKTEETIKKFISAEEYDQLSKNKNMATQLVYRQADELRILRSEGLIDDFRHIELQNLLNSLYVHQGMAERIKKFPFPRQFGSMSMVFIGIFIFLLPFGMMNAFEGFGDRFIWLAIPFSVLVAWIYLVMELVGDYSENPFEGLPNDVPMLAICRSIEIDLREMIKDEHIPDPIKPRESILM
jgi:putative membrane protein